MSLGLLIDGIQDLLPRDDKPCYQYKLIYGLFIVPIITSFFSVLGMAIERFQAFALYRDRRRLTRRFSIAWSMASWTLALCFLVILFGQIVEKGPQERYNDEVILAPHHPSAANLGDEDNEAASYAHQFFNSFYFNLRYVKYLTKGLLITQLTCQYASW